MVITIGYDIVDEVYTAELYVKGMIKSHVRLVSIMQLVYLIKILHPVYPVSISWQAKLNVQIKAQIVRALQANIKIQ